MLRKYNRSPKAKGLQLESEWLVITHLSIFQTCCNVMNKLHLSIMSRYKTFHRNQYTNIFLGNFLNIEENNSWTIQCHSYEIFQVNALIGVLPFSDWPCWGSRTVYIKCRFFSLIRELMKKWLALEMKELCNFTFIRNLWISFIIICQPDCFHISSREMFISL